jgi:hypothetical protein
MDPIKQALIGSLPAVLVSFFFLAISWKIWRRGQSGPGHWGTALGLALGYAGTHFAIHDWSFPYPPKLVSDWVLYVGLAAGAVGLLESSGKVKPPVRLTFYVLLAAFLAWIVPGLRSFGEDAAYQRWVWTGIAFVYALCVALATDKTTEEGDGPWLAVAWTILTGAFAFVCVQGGTGKIGQLVGGLSAVLGVAASIGFVHKRFSLRHGGVAVTAFVFSGLLLAVQLFTEVEMVGKLPFAAAPFAFWIVSEVPSRWLRILLWLVLAALAATTGVLGTYEEPYGGY